MYTIQKSVPSYTLYLVNYRGYGRSSGTPSEHGIYEDALAIYDEIKRSHETISVIGRSLGTGVATYLAVERVLEKIVLVTPYDSIRNVAQKSFPIYPMSILLKDKYESDKRAKDIKIPVLIVIAGRDQVIPNERSLALVKAFDNKNLIVEEIQAADHNDISTYTKYDEIIKNFLSN
ncbi:MAG: alpha/beta hydrolase [Proteobacteria bacterium]|nr:alpha/beta hydrolase [Pseudomonadota bacterium]